MAPLLQLKYGGVEESSDVLPQDNFQTVSNSVGHGVNSFFCHVPDWHIY